MSVSVVLPSGEVLTASLDDHDDLFWALRGGGGGIFGVVTSFTFRTFPITDRDVVTLAFPEGTTEQAILGWDEWLRTADRAIWGMVNITVGSGSGGCTIVLATHLATGRVEPMISAPRLGCSPSAIGAERSTAWTSSTISKVAPTQRSRGRSWRGRTSWVR